LLPKRWVFSWTVGGEKEGKIERKKRQDVWENFLVVGEKQKEEGGRVTGKGDGDKPKGRRKKIKTVS